MKDGHYIEESHEAIIDPAEWDAVQDEMKRRKEFGKAYSGKSVMSMRIVCGDCGGWYGPKTWHSTDQYKTVVWQCSSKFEKSKPQCETPHITEEEIKERFLKIYNGLIESKADHFYFFPLTYYLFPKKYPPHGLVRGFFIYYTNTVT